SSRRRHTRSKRDWSSDVCSSDLGVAEAEQIIIVAAGRDGVREVARHGRARPGSPKIDDEHFPTDATQKVPGVYAVTANSPDEEAFLMIRSEERRVGIELGCRSSY